MRGFLSVLLCLFCASPVLAQQATRVPVEQAGHTIQLTAQLYRPASPQPLPAVAFLLVGYEGVQMHGGIGMTDEHDVGFYLKRARAAELAFGDAAWHRDRVARIDGY